MNILKILNIFRPFRSSQLDERIAVCARVESKTLMTATIKPGQRYIAGVVMANLYNPTRVRRQTLHTAVVGINPLLTVARIRSKCR